MLDSAFAKPTVFIKLYKKANLTHVRHTFGLSGQTEDKQIYDLATKEDRIIITQDDDFKTLVKLNQAGVFIIPSYLSNIEIDKVITAFVFGKDPKNFVGKVTKL